MNTTQLTKRSADEILARIEAIEAEDWMGTQVSDLLLYLDYELALPKLKAGTTAQQFAEYQKGLLSPEEKAREYLDFAWGKANDQRGLSAGRSIDHFSAWLWLAGYPPEYVDPWQVYSFYGKPQLVQISTLLGVFWQHLDDGHWDDGSSKGASDGVRAAMIADAVKSATEMKEKLDAARRI